MDIFKQINPTRAVSFSGHRPERLPGKGISDEPETQRLIICLREQIENAIRRGREIFVNGLMAGFDVLAAEQVITLKDKYPHIRIVTVAPYSVHYFSHEKCWTPEWIDRAKNICVQHDFGVSLSEHYRSGIYYERNRVLVDHSSELFCCWDGGRGGTQYTVQYAEHKGVSLCNLFT